MARETQSDKESKLSKNFYSSNPKKLTSDLSSLAGVTRLTDDNLSEVRLKVEKAKLTEMLKGASVEDKNTLGNPNTTTINSMSLEELQFTGKKLQFLQGQQEVLHHVTEEVAKKEGKIVFDKHVTKSNFGAVFAEVSGTDEILARMESITGSKAVSEMSPKEINKALTRIEAAKTQYFETVVSNAKICLIAEEMEKSGKTLEVLTAELDRGEHDDKLMKINALLETINPVSEVNTTKLQSPELYKLERLSEMSKFLKLKSEIKQMQSISANALTEATSVLTGLGATKSPEGETKKVSVKDRIQAIQGGKGKENIAIN